MSLLDNDFDLNEKDLDVILIKNIIQNSSYPYKEFVNCDNIVYNPDSIKDINERDYRYHAMYITLLHKGFPSEIKFEIEWHWYPHCDIYSSPVLVDEHLVSLKKYMKNRCS